jgi:hypothetical protein
VKILTPRAAPHSFFKLVGDFFSLWNYCGRYLVVGFVADVKRELVFCPVVDLSYLAISKFFIMPSHGLGFPPSQVFL